MIRAFAREEITTSDVSTNRLLALALSLRTVPGWSDLYGRDHAFYAIASSRPAAIEFALCATDDSERRRMAARALAMAGYDLAGVQEAITNEISGKLPG